MEKHRLQFISRVFELNDYLIKKVDGNFYLVSKKVCGVTIKLSFGEYGMTIRCNLHLGEKWIKLLNPRFKIDLYQESFQYSIQSSGKKFMELLGLQETEILHGKREAEQGYIIPDEIQSSFKAFFYNTTKNIFDELATIDSIYDFFENKFSINVDAYIFASRTSQRLTLKAIVGASDYEYYKAYFLNYFKISGSDWFGNTSQEDVTRFVTELDKLFAVAEKNIKDKRRSQGVYRMSNQEIIEAQKHILREDIKNQLIKTNQKEQELLLKDKSLYTQIDLINKVGFSKSYSELNFKLERGLKKLEKLKEDILANPDFDSNKYIEKYKDEQQCEAAICNIQLMSFVVKALDNKEETNEKQ